MSFFSEVIDLQNSIAFQELSKRSGKSLDELLVSSEIKALDFYIQKQIKYFDNRGKNDAEAKRKLELAKATISVNDDPQMEQGRSEFQEIAIQFLSSAIMLAGNKKLLAEIYLERAKIFLLKKLYYNSLYDSDYVLQSCLNDKDPLEQVASNIYIESCLEIIEQNIDKAKNFGLISKKPVGYPFQKTRIQKTRLRSWRIASEFLDRLRVEITIQVMTNRQRDEMMQRMRNLTKKVREFDINSLVNNLNDQNKANILQQKFERYVYKISNGPDVIDQNGRFRLLMPSIGCSPVVMFEKPTSFLETQPLVHCGWCAKWLGFKFVPCQTCDETVFCNEICKRLAEKVNNHSMICRYAHYVSRAFNTECYLIFVEYAKNIRLSFDLNYEMNDEKRQTIIEKYRLTLEQSIKVFSLILSLIIKNKNMLPTNDQNLTKEFVEVIQKRLSNFVMSPFLYKKIKHLKSTKREERNRALDPHIYTHAMLDYILPTVSSDFNIVRLYKSGKIVYKLVPNKINRKIAQQGDLLRLALS